METMKDDMGGAASILATMKVIAQLKPKINVIAAIPCSENMPSGSAQKPGDVITHRGGTTSEVLNTDAEGRLVLADALAYLAEKKPQLIIDTATLTGACMVALGDRITGAFGNDRDLVRDLVAAGDAVGEPMWEMPLYKDYRALIDSPVADIKNIGDRWGGAITAAWFLAEFVGETPWVHLDIAGPAFTDRAHRPRTAWARPACRCARSCGSCSTAPAPEEAARGRRRTTRHRSRAPARCSRVFAHPDDAEISAAARSRSGAPPAARSTCWCSRTATVARATPRWIAPTSRASAYAETEAAGEVLGLASVADPRASTTASWRTPTTSREAVTRRIREVRAETRPLLSTRRCLLQNSYYNHSDHRTAGFDRARLGVPGFGQPALLLRASGGGARGAGGAPTSGSGGRTSRTTSRTSASTSRAKIDALANTTSQLAEGHPVLRGVPGRGRGASRREDRRHARRGVPRPGSSVSGRTHGSIGERSAPVWSPPCCWSWWPRSRSARREADRPAPRAPPPHWHP